MCPILGTLSAEIADSSIQVQEHVEEGKFYTSHPAMVKVVKTDYRQQSSQPETLLRVTMETIVPDRIGYRRSNLFFSHQHVSEYVEAIDRYLRMSENHSTTERVEIARIPSWETFQQQRDLVFSYNPVSSQQASNTAGSAPLLGINLAYDMENRGGSFFFTPTGARELLNLLFDFMGEV